LGILAARVLAFLVDQPIPRDSLVLAGVVLAMMVLRLLATWIPALQNQGTPWEIFSWISGMAIRAAEPYHR